jgi:hypothetical protein
LQPERADIDARMLVAFEGFVGEPWKGSSESSIPNDRSAEIILAQFDDVRQFLRVQLMAQTHYKEIFDLIKVEFDATTDRFAPNPDSFESYLTALVSAGNAARSSIEGKPDPGLDFYIE